MLADPPSKRKEKKRKEKIHKAEKRPITNALISIIDCKTYYDISR